MREKLNEKAMETLRKTLQLFKVNLPDTFELYQSGNGEGIWACPADKETEDLWKNDTDGQQGVVYACNDSFYYPGEIVFGSRVLVEFRGENRPVAVWDDLHGTAEAEQNKEKIMHKLTGENDNALQDLS